MTRRTHFACLLALLLAAGAGHAALKTIEEAFELILGQVTLPASDTGTLVVRRCAGCKPEVLRVDAATRYLLRRSPTPVTRKVFTGAAAQVAGRSDAMILVYYDPQTRGVRRLILEPGR